MNAFGKPHLEQVAVGWVLAVGPEAEVKQQLVEAALKEHQVRPPPADPLGDLVHPPAGVGVHGRGQVVEVVLVCVGKEE